MIVEASRVFPKPQLLSSKAKVTASEVGDQWNGPVLQQLDPTNSALSNYSNVNQPAVVVDPSRHNSGGIKSSVKTAAASPKYSTKK